MFHGFLLVRIMSPLTQPIIRARDAIVSLPSIGLGMSNIKAMKNAMMAPNFPITLNCAKSFAAPISVSKSMGVFMVVIKSSTILRWAESLAGAKGMDRKKPKVPAIKTPKNLA